MEHDKLSNHKYEPVGHHLQLAVQEVATSASSGIQIGGHRNNFSVDLRKSIAHISLCTYTLLAANATTTWCGLYLVV